MAIVVIDPLPRSINRMWEPVFYVRYPASSYEFLAKVVFARLVDAFPLSDIEGFEKYSVYQIYYLRRALIYLFLILLQASGIVAQ